MIPWNDLLGSIILVAMSFYYLKARGIHSMNLRKLNQILRVSIVVGLGLIITTLSETPKAYSQPYPLNGIPWEFWFSAEDGRNFYLSNTYSQETSTYRNFYLWVQFTRSKPGEPRSLVAKGSVGCAAKFAQALNGTTYDTNNHMIKETIYLAEKLPFDLKISNKYCQGVTTTP